MFSFSYDISYFVDVFLSSVSNFLDSVLFLDFFQFFNTEIKMPFLPLWLFGMSLYFFIKNKMYDFKFLSLAIGFFRSKAFTAEQKKEIKENKRNLQTTKDVMSLILGSNIDIGSMFGVAVAISVGGRGVIFWMIVITIISTSVRMLEVYSGNKYRIQSNDKSTFEGGPYTYIEKTFIKEKYLKFAKKMAIMFSLCVAFSVLPAPLTNQAVNVVSTFIPNTLNYKWLISILFTSFILFAIHSPNIGIMNKIISKTVKPMSIIYILATITIVIFNIKELPHAVYSIVEDAFSFKAGLSGFVASFVIAIKRTFYCNECGMGTSAIAHAKSANKNYITESIISTIEPIISVLIVCICSGFIIVITNADLVTSDSLGMMLHAFSSVHKHFSLLLIIIIPLFGLTTSIAWAYYAKNSWKNKISKNVFPFLIVYTFSQWVSGTSSNFNTIMDLADVVNLSISIPNIISLFFIFKREKREILGYKQSVNY